jgi:putative DNA primase/helicase
VWAAHRAAVGDVRGVHRVVVTTGADHAHPRRDGATHMSTPGMTFKQSHSSREQAGDLRRGRAAEGERRNEAAGSSKTTDHGEVDPPGQPMPNARRFLEGAFPHPERTLLIHQGGQFYRWDGTCWPPVEDAILRALIYRWFERRWYWDKSASTARQKPFAPTVRKVADLMDALRAVTIIPTSAVTPSWLGDSSFPANEIIACSNGLVHWPTRTLLPHTPLHYSHHSVPFAFDTDAPPPARWLEFLRDLWEKDVESIETLQELFGYLVSGDTSLQKMFLVIGPKRSGKGTIARVGKAMLGAHNVAGPTLAGIATNFGLQPLIGKPVAIIADARLGAKADGSIVTERLLSISGEDTLTIDRKYAEPWTGQLGSRIVILSNELPRLSDSSGAFASRFIVLRMTVSFFGREKSTLTDELIAELPGIFNWSLDGLARLRTRGRFRQPASSQQHIRTMEDLASPISAFIRDECRLDPTLNVRCDRLYAAWRAWCETSGRSHPGNAQLFGRDLRAAMPGVHVRQLGSERDRHYIGISTRESREPRACMRCAGEGCQWCSAAARS